MKKFLSLMLAMAMTLSLAACGGTQESTTTSESTTTTEEKTPAATTQSTSVNYPSKEIRVIVAYSPGGSTDLVARKVVDIINANGYLDQTMVVVNMPDGGTKQGLEAVLDAEPDGHTILLHQNGMNAAYSVGQIPYNYQDFESIAGVIEYAFMLIGNDTANIDDYVAKAAADASAIKAGTLSIGSTGHLAMEYYLQNTNQKDSIPYFNYSGGSDARKALLAGEVDFISAVSSEMVGYDPDGDMQPLLMLSAERSSYMEEVPCLGDLGLDATFAVKSGFFAPIGTPDEAIQILQDAIEKACATDDFKEFAAGAWAEVAYRDADAYTQYMAEDLEVVMELAETITGG